MTRTADPPGAPPFTLLILAGGSSSRMGRDKAAIPFPGPSDPPLVWRIHERLSPLSVSCLVAGPTAYGLPCPAVGDRGPRGPLGGLLGGLDRAETDLVMAVACDLPNCSPELAAALVGAARSHPDADAVVPWRDGRPEPLFAVYRRRAGAVQVPEHGPRGPSLQWLLDRLAVLSVPEDQWRPLDPGEGSFSGCNTPQELAQASAGQRGDAP